MQTPQHPEQQDRPEVGDGVGDDHDREAHDLRSSLDALSLMSTAQQPLNETLRSIAELAVRAIPGADGAGLTLLRENRSDTVVTTAEFVAEIDAIQYGIGQGPCITAAAEGVTVVSGSLGADARWRRFGSQVARLGVHSVVSLPLMTENQVIGAMNVYARGKDTFDDRAAELGQMFAVPAAIAVHNAHVLTEARRLTERLQHALEERGLVDQAVGILISRSGETAAEAMERLRTLSQHEHRKLPDVARGIVEQAARRAQARHAEPDPG